MQELEITCVTQRNGVITHVGIGGVHQSVEQVVYWIQNGIYSVYTNKYGYKATVYPKRSYYSGRWFLTTERDGTRENNLDFLPTCVVT
jgi:hypothetical protein